MSLVEGKCLCLLCECSALTNAAFALLVKVTFHGTIFSSFFKVSKTLQFRFWVQDRTTQLRKLEQPNYQHKFATGHKNLFYFSAEILLWFGRNLEMKINYLKSSFCNIFYN